MGTLERIKEVKDILPYFMKYKSIRSNYDKETDTLYMQFSKPNYVSNSEMTDDDIIIRYNEEGDIIGITILNASTR